MTLTKIFTGMERGPEKIDDNFSSIDNTLSKLSFSDSQPYSGFVLSNGATWYGTGPGSLTKVELPGDYRLITIEAVLKIADFTATKGKTILSIPQQFAPSHSVAVAMPSSGTMMARWSVSAAGNFAIENITDEKKTNVNTWYPIYMTYLTHNH